MVWIEVTDEYEVAPSIPMPYGDIPNLRRVLDQARRGQTKTCATEASRG
jgi:hypothetical protein